MEHDSSNITKPVVPPEAASTDHLPEGLLVKDPDAIKLFVGQIPKDMEEQDLKPIFEEFGQIFDLMVIRDKATGAHRRCAFLTYCRRNSAEQAIAELHGQRKLPNAQNPLQVRPAEGQAERENKLFVGMVPKVADEDALREVFAKYGDIKEIHIIRNQDGSNKGCAFLKFVERQSALDAIAELHEQYTMEGGPRPLVVKFADNKRGQSRDNQLGVGIPALGVYHSGLLDSQGLPAGLSAAQLAALQGQLAAQGLGIAGAPTGAGGSDLATGYWPLMGVPGQTPYYTLQQAPHLQAVPTLGMPYLYGAAAASPTGGNGPSAYQVYYSPQLTAVTSPQPPGQYLSPSQLGTAGAPAPPLPANASQTYGSPTQSPMQPTVTPPRLDMGPSEMGTTGGSPQLSAQNNSQFRPSRGYSVSQGPDGGGRQEGSSQSRTLEGPLGANLFIYHLPHDLTDADLATAFAPFGNVISAKVYVDKNTGQSKGFGFVSYDQPASAETAIAAMNGFQIGTKRLKVQHKRVPGNLDPNQAPRMQQQHLQVQYQGSGGSIQSQNPTYPQDVSSVLRPSFKSLNINDL